MNYGLKRFRLTLTPQGPVFIGSGEKRTAKEYIKGSRSVYSPDMDLLYADIARRGKAESFESFMLGPAGHGGRSGPAGAMRLDQWLGQNRIDPAPRVHGGYGIVLGDLMAATAGGDRRGRGAVSGQPQLHDIHSHIKTAFGQPYVPGSSVKGLLRTLFLQQRVLRTRGTPAAIVVNEHTKAKDVESSQLRTLNREHTRPNDAVNDIFQAIRVSDSEPLATSDLAICQKIDAGVSGELAGLPLHRECLKPRSAITVDVTVDTGIGPGGLEFVRQLGDIAGFVNDRHFVPYVNKFDIADLAPAVSGPFVYLGGGAGFRSKTFVDDQVVMAKILDRAFRKIGHLDKTRRLGVSPLALKVTKIGGVVYEMGKCQLGVEEIT